MDKHTANESKQPPSPYTAFLVRCWYEGGQWRFAVETIGRARQKKHFISLEALGIYVQDLLRDVEQTTSAQDLDSL